MKKYILNINNSLKLALLAIVLTTVSCNLDEKYYTEVIPETFYKDKRSVLSVLNKPYTHARYFVENDRWRLQELTGDAFCVTTKGQHWYNGAAFQRFHRHQWTPEDGMIWDTWRVGTMGIALAMEAMNELTEHADYEKIGFTEEDRLNHQAQLNTIIAYLYMRCLDFFGGMPIFESLKESNVPRATSQETFDHIEKILKETIPLLKKKTDSSMTVDGELTQAAGAMMLAQLYFNAKSYIGKDMFDKCEEICLDIINEEYGVYSLDETWNGPHGFDNDRSPEVIWGFPSQNAKLQYEWFWADFYHYESYKYFNLEGGANNGYHLQPSRKPTDELYTDADFRMGRPYEKFNDQDLRKKPYVYLGNKEYEGMFLVGDQMNPVTGEWSMGSQEYKGEKLTLVDRVAKYKEKNIDYRVGGDLPSTMADGEESTGIRLVKVPQPNLADKSLRWNSDHPHFRLAEVYYMYAECLLRRGEKAEAAKHINEVRGRNFEDGIDPDPVTVANLDDEGYRMLDEWLIEFLGEGRRRIDLIRWDKFLSEKWWDHQPTNNKNLLLFPVPTNAISGDNTLKQNPGY